MSSTPEAPDRHSDATPRGRGLRDLLLGRPNRVQVVVAVLLAALGFAAVVQVRLTHTNEAFGGARRGDLVELLDSLSGAADRAQKQIDELEQTRATLASNSQRRQAVEAEIRDRLKVLEVLTGTVAATGPGVTLTIEDPHDAVTAPVLLDGIEELRDAGAEAIEINDSVRVVASTSFTSDNGQLSADGVTLTPPYVIDAIGSAHTLSDAVDFPGGLRDDVEQLGGTVATRQSESVEVGSLHTPTPPEYAQPTP